MENAGRHEEKICPRCERSFWCKPGNIANCECSSFKLTAASISCISKIYDDCLCSKCLLEWCNMLPEEDRGFNQAYRINKG